MGQYGTPLSGSMLSVVFRNAAHNERTLNSYDLFQEFRSANDVLYWNLNLSEAIHACRMVGHLHPYVLLIEGPKTSVEDVKTAWTKRLLKFPQGFVIESIGEVNGLYMVNIPQVASIPLEEALCYIIYDLNCTERSTSIEAICVTLARWYGEMQMPPVSVIQATLNSLIKAGQIYHTGYGYSIVTSDKVHVIRWLSGLPSDFHSDTASIHTTSTGGSPNHQPPVPAHQSRPLSPGPQQMVQPSGFTLCLGPPKHTHSRSTPIAAPSTPRERPFSTPPVQQPRRQDRSGTHHHAAAVAAFTCTTAPISSPTNSDNMSGFHGNTNMNTTSTRKGRQRHADSQEHEHNQPKLKESKSSFITRLISLLKPRKHSHPQPSGTISHRVASPDLSLRHHMAPSPIPVGGPPLSSPCSPNPRLWASAWSPSPSHPNYYQQAPPHTPHFTLHSAYHPSPGGYSAGQPSYGVPGCSQRVLPSALSDDYVLNNQPPINHHHYYNPPTNGVTLDLPRRNRVNGLRTNPHLRHSFALGDNVARPTPVKPDWLAAQQASNSADTHPSMSQHMLMPEDLEEEEEVGSGSTEGEQQPVRKAVTAPTPPPRTSIASVNGGMGGSRGTPRPLLSPPSTHDSGFNSSRTLLDFENSEIGGSGGTAGSLGFPQPSKAEMLKRRMTDGLETP